MDASSEQEHHHQDIISSQALENMLVSTKGQQEKKPRPAEEALKCPRCESTNTKFCYYNNYNLSQPRYFCKACRRYWTKGGTLRNVPVGGRCRKTKRSSSSSSTSSKRFQDQPLTANPNPLISTLGQPESSDLTLALARLQSQAIGFGHVIENSAGVNTCSPGLVFLDENGLYNLQYSHMGANISEEMLISYEDMSVVPTTTAMAVPAVKRSEFCDGEDGENRVLWGFPRKVGMDGNIGDLDSGIQSWNGFGSLWHGIVNSPLM